ncbi:hypothetical protein DFJ63DRAFT_337559 [Scheffersomyces coipomensis]|uniref:uncharacterized protein n=1 Tax=Scheffersomyces coipomensis TaxID=1788519 RepID=UPI00315D4A1A
MDNIFTALSLSLMDRKRFVISTSNVNTLIKLLVNGILRKVCKFNESQIEVIDLLEYSNEEELIRRCVKEIEGGEYELKNILIWKNMQKVKPELQKILYMLLTKIDLYDTNESRHNPKPVILKGYTINRPSLFTSITVLDNKLYHMKIDQYLKAKFWFSINYVFEPNHEYETKNIVFPLENLTYIENILYLRNSIQKVYVKPDIQRYIYSLVIQVRNHRLCSLAPRQTRLSTRSIDDVLNLSKAMVVWQRHTSDDLFVTADFVKVAMRKIGYWLVDWEYNTLYTSKELLPDRSANFDAEQVEEKDYQRRMEISMMTGSWFGSDYDYVKKYLLKSESTKDDSTPTGVTNIIIEEALVAVRPPI